MNTQKVQAEITVWKMCSHKTKLLNHNPLKYSGYYNRKFSADASSIMPAIPQKGQHEGWMLVLS